MRERWQPFPRLFPLGLLALAGAAAAQDVPPPPPQEVTLQLYGPPDPPALERGCAEGSVENCKYLAILYERGEPGDGVEQDPERARPLWVRVAELSRKSCEAGQLAGCIELGRAYGLGRGLEKDPARAAELYAKGCEARDAWSCFALGKLHARGEGVPQDRSRAAELYRRACDAGFKPACEEANRFAPG